MATWYWHVHHDILCEPLTEPIETRIDYIRKNKKADEIELRLRLMKPVRGKIPSIIREAEKTYAEARKAYDEAWKACAEARKAYDEAGKACGEAWQACGEAWKAYGEARKACGEAGRAYGEAWKAYGEAGQAYDEAGKAYLGNLHRRECPGCPWDGKTIFSKKEA